MNFGRQNQEKKFCNAASARVRLLFGIQLAVAICVLNFSNQNLSAQVNELQKNATWNVPTIGESTELVRKWIAEQAKEELVVAKAEALWAIEPETNLELLNRFGMTVAIVHPELQPIVDSIDKRVKFIKSDHKKLFTNSSLPKFVKSNLCLLYGRALAQQELYDESLLILKDIRPSEVVDPATLLFYKGICYQRLLQKDEALETLNLLDENSESIPVRYRQLTQLMIRDLKPLKVDSLDEISRIMDDIQRRQKLFRSGTKVRKQEDDVISKLDKMIKKLEEQAQKSSGKGGTSMGGDPLDDSLPAGGSGPGEVTPKKQSDGGSWGNLPPKQRAAAMANLVKDLPPHFREVIEAYFRKIASQDQSR